MKTETITLSFFQADDDNIVVSVDISKKESLLPTERDKLSKAEQAQINLMLLFANHINQLLQEGTETDVTTQ
jgi:hypothetical protein